MVNMGDAGLPYKSLDYKLPACFREKQNAPEFRT